MFKTCNSSLPQSLRKLTGTPGKNGIQGCPTSAWARGGGGASHGGHASANTFWCLSAGFLSNLPGRLVQILQTNYDPSLAQSMPVSRDVVKLLRPSRRQDDRGAVQTYGQRFRVRRFTYSRTYSHTTSIHTYSRTTWSK